MNDSSPAPSLGCRLFGLAAVGFGVITLTWHAYNGWHLPLYAAYAAAIAEIFGGVAIQFRVIAQTAAVVLATIYFIFAVSCLPAIVAAPRVYNSYGNFFEQFSLATGAALAYAWVSSPGTREALYRMSRIFFGSCVLSFAIEQAVYFHPTASLVPRWLPPGQAFWAGATTAFFALGAVALLANRKAPLAARLLTAMLLIFGLLVWAPLVLSHPHDPANWSETVETFAIAGAAWVLADLEGRPVSGRK